MGEKISPGIFLGKTCFTQVFKSCLLSHISLVELCGDVRENFIMIVAWRTYGHSPFIHHFLLRIYFECNETGFSDFFFLTQLGVCWAVEGRQTYSGCRWCEADHNWCGKAWQSTTHGGEGHFLRTVFFMVALVSQPAIKSAPSIIILDPDDVWSSAVSQVNFPIECLYCDDDRKVRHMSWTELWDIVWQLFRPYRGWYNDSIRLQAMSAFPWKRTKVEMVIMDAPSWRVCCSQAAMTMRNYCRHIERWSCPEMQAHSSSRRNRRWEELWGFMRAE